MNAIEEYQRELEEKITTLNNYNTEAEIEEKIAEYRKTLEAQIQERQAKEFEKLNIELNCVNNIIERLKQEAQNFEAQAPQGDMPEAIIDNRNQIQIQ